MFKIRRPPKEPKAKRTITADIPDFLFEDHPVSEWLSIVTKYLDNSHYAGIWDIADVTLADIKVVAEWEGNYSDMELRVTIRETDEAFTEQHKLWEEKFREWEEWTALHMDEIQAEEERREAKKIEDQKNKIACARQKTKDEIDRLQEMLDQGEK